MSISGNISSYEVYNLQQRMSGVCVAALKPLLGERLRRCIFHHLSFCFGYSQGINSLPEHF